MSSVRSGNLVKAFYLRREGVEPRVIDSNSIIEEKLGDLKYSSPVYSYNESDELSEDYGSEPVFEDGLDADTLNALVGDPSDIEYEGEYDEEGNPVSNVIKAVPSYDEPAPEQFGEPEYSDLNRDDMLAEANAEIEAMRAQAADEIEKEKALAREEGRAEGYNEGKAMAQAEMVEAAAQIEQERNALQQQYEEMVDDLEPKFVHTLTSIYEKIFEVDLSGQKELIINLLHNAMLHVEGSKNYLIHVSHEDYEYVVENRDNLKTESMAADAVIDIIEDVTMKAGDCMIETDGGIFDCSLGTELALLRKKLELLSYSPDQ